MSATPTRFGARLRYPGRTRRTAVLSVLTLVFSLFVGLPPTTAVADTGTGFNPTALRIVGFPAHAEMYGWGAATLLDGSVLIGDYWNFRVRHFAVDGSLIGDFINNPGFQYGQTQAPYGMGVDPVTGDVYLADTDRYKVDKYTSTGTFITQFGTQGTGVGQFLYPSRVAVAADERVFVVDTWANVIKVFTPSGTQLFQFGGTGSKNGQMRAPHGAAFDQYGRLWVADNGNHRIDVFDSNGNFLFKFGSQGSGPGQFQGDMRGLAIDRQNSWVYQVDAQGNHVDKFGYTASTSATNLPTYLLRWGTTGSDPGNFIDGGREITVDGQHNVWVGDMPNFRVQRFTSDGQLLSYYPNPAVPPAPGGFNHPRGVAVDSRGNMFVTDTYNQRIEKLAADGSFVYQWGTRGRSDDAFNYPRLLAIDPRNDNLVVADTDNDRIKMFTNDGGTIWDVGGQGGGPDQFRNPHGITIAPDGTIYVADSNNARVVVMNEDGTFRSAFGVKGTLDGQFKYPRGIVYDTTDGSLWISDSSRNIVDHFTTSGTYLGKIGTPGKNDNQLQSPWDVQVDNHFLYVADTNANKIKVFNKATGAFVQVIGGPGKRLGQMYGPEGMDLVNGNLYVADENNERIQEFSVTTPPTFSGIKSATAVSANETDLSWTAATDDLTPASQIAYQVCRATDPNTCASSFSVYATSAPGATTYADTNLTPGQAYWYTVRAVDTDGQVDSNTITLSPPPKFAGVTSVSATGFTSVNVNWAAATDYVTPPSQMTYQVCWSTTSGSCATSFVAKAISNPGDTSLNLTGLTPGQTYYVVVRALNGAGITDSNTVQMSAATQADVTAPTFAGLSSAGNPNATSIDLSWQDATDDVTPPSGITYQICQSTTSGACAASFAATYSVTGQDTYTANNLSPATTYYYVVRAVDATGNRDTNTVEMSATTLPDVSPPTFGGVTSAVAKSKSTIQLGWSPATDAETPQSQITYLVCRATNATTCVTKFKTSYTTAPGATGYLVTTLATASLQYFVVRALDAGGHTDGNTNQILMTTQGDTTAPTFSGAGSANSVNATTASVNWSAATDNLTPSANLVYDVCVSTTSGQCAASFTPSVTTAQAATSYTFTGLTPSTTYYYVVRAKDLNSNEDANTAEVSTTTTADISPPTFAGVSGVTATSPTSLHVTWSAGTDDVTTQPNLVYDVCVSMSANACTTAFAPTLTSSAGATAADLTGLTPNTQYYIVVRSRDQSANEDNNTVQLGAATPPDTTAPAFAGASAANPVANDPTRMTVSWSPATDDVTSSAAISYLVCRSTTAGACAGSFLSIGQTAPGATSFTDSGLSPSTTYYYVVRAVDQANNVDMNTVEVSGTTSADQTPPTFGGVTGATAISKSRVDLTWAAATDVFTPSSSIVYDICRTLSTTVCINHFTANFTSAPGAAGMSITGLSPNSTYQFVVRARDGAGNEDTNTVQISAQTPAS